MPQENSTQVNHGSASVGPLGFLQRAKARTAQSDGLPPYALLDVIAAMSDGTEDRQKLWDQLVSNEPQLAALTQPATFVLADGSSKILDSVDMEGVFRLAQ